MSNLYLLITEVKSVVLDPFLLVLFVVSPPDAPAGRRSTFDVLLSKNKIENNVKISVHEYLIFA